MRLLDTKNLKLHEFFGSAIPKYSILSHTWEDEEISYQDMLATRSSIDSKSGYQKVRKAAKVARSMGYNFIWVDTCCIDKSSSAELTEAINSMYQWYKDSSLCLAYLADVPHGFSASRWFTRGWTLQELIAPTQLLFLSSEWRQIGWKMGLKTEIQNITGIPAAVLGNGYRTTEWCVAEKMSWAAHRTTTRPEDMAYCLLGLFDINMPLLYGEGSRAFSRLQEEVIKHNNDHTIFLWSSADTGLCSYRGLLARSPKEFQDCHGIAVDLQDQGNSTPFSMTNAGLHLDVPLVPWAAVASAVSSPFADPTMKDKCIIEAAERNLFLPVFRGLESTIFLVRLDQDGEQYARIWPSMTPKLEQGLLDRLEAILSKKSCYIRQNVLIPRNHVPVSFPEFYLHPVTSNTGLYGGWIRIFEGGGVEKTFLKSSSPGSSQSGKEVLRLEAIVAEVQLKYDSCLHVVVGYDSDNGECWCDVGSEDVIPLLLEDYRQIGRVKGPGLATWSNIKWSCYVRVRKELINDRLVVSIRAMVDFSDLG